MIKISAKVQAVVNVNITVAKDTINAKVRTHAKALTNVKVQTHAKAPTVAKQQIVVKILMTVARDKYPVLAFR